MESNFGSKSGKKSNLEDPDVSRMRGNDSNIFFFW
jgi:hypothetical protein